MSAVPATRKRLREEALGETSKPHRSALASRIHATPRFWHHDATAAGVAGAEAFLVHLGRSIAAALASTAESAEAARAQLQNSRAALHFAIDERCDALGARIDSTESAKSASLERELVAVDAALERWRAEAGAVGDAASSMSDTELEACHAALSSRLYDLEVQLQALPTSVVEPPVVGLFADLPSLLRFGQVCAPFAIAAAELHLESLSNTRSEKCGYTLRFRLALGPRHALHSAKELEISLGMVAAAIRIEATLDIPGVPAQCMQAVLASDTTERCLVVSFSIPTAIAIGAAVNISAVFVAGLPVLGLPVNLSVLCRGITVPLVLPYAVTFASGLHTPCITPEGRVYCPPVARNSIFDVAPTSPDEVLIFDADGTQLPGIPIASLGFAGINCAAYFSHAVTPSLLLAGRSTKSSCVIAVDPETRALRWTSAVTADTDGIAVLPAQGVVVLGGIKSLVAHRLTDGSRVGSVALDASARTLAADATTGVVYGLTGGSTRGAAAVIRSWSCTSTEAGILIMRDGPSVAVGDGRLIAIVPPAPGKRVSHLVVCTTIRAELLVFSLPNLVLVHTHTVMLSRYTKMSSIVTALAADPWGGALAMYNILDRALHVLPWPLTGMPLLE